MTTERVLLPEAGERILRYDVLPGGRIQVLTMSGGVEFWEVQVDVSCTAPFHVEIRLWSDRGR